MPLLMQPEDADLWLQGEGLQGKADGCADILQREPVAELSYYRVGLMVNNPRNQSKETLDPVDD